MTPEKTDYPPLLDGGFHDFELSELKKLTVDGFPLSTRRPALFSALSVYLDLLANTGLKAEIWVDGSFMSSKLEPDDIDMVVAFDPDSARAMPASTRPVVVNLLDTNFVSARFNLHLFRVSKSDTEGVAFWSHLFGTLRDERTPKGMALLRINP